MVVKRRVLSVFVVLAAAVLAASQTDYLSMVHKIESVRGGRLRAGSRVELTARELNAYAAEVAPNGISRPSVVLTGAQTATATALVDFGKLRRAQGHEPGWLMAKLLDGERPVSVTGRIRSAGGQATVEVEQVQVSGMELDGRTLDFLIDNVLLPLYPEAAIGRPFDLGYRIEKIDVRPGGVGLVIGR